MWEQSLQLLEWDTKQTMMVSMLQTHILKQILKEQKKQNFLFGLYFYSYAKNVNQAKEQANWVKENIKGYEIDLGIAFDWESWNSFNTCRNELLYNK